MWLNQNNSTPIKKDFFTYAIVNHKQISVNNLLENLASNDLSELVRDIKKIIENNSITCTLTNNIRKPYIDKETFKFIQIKRNYEKLKIKYPKSTYLHNKWKQYRNKVSNLCRHAKEKFLSCFFINNCTNSRKVWCQMNNCLGKSPKREYEAVSMLNENGITITDKKLISNILNAHQIDVSKKIILDSNVSKDEVINYHAFDFVDISTPFSCPQCTEDEIEQIINKLKPSNAIDIYGMSNNFLKIHRDELTKILNVLINKHMFNGDFPDALKFAVVKPIYKKKGSKLDKDNYRPISILPIVSKIYESVIYRRIYTHCKNNKYFNEEQFGYQEKSNPETAMIHTLNDIYKKIDSKLVTALLTIDLSKAFDCINHEILLSKLTKLQFPAFFIKLLKSYLENRYQAVKIDDILSDPLLIICGTPQGGVLSGLFFNIYVNSIFNLLLSSVLRLYCDDMSLIASGTSKETLKVNLEHDLFLINKWLSLHYLKANYSKTQYVLFSGRKKFEAFTERSLELKMNDTLIERVESVKIVGLAVDEQLNFSNHISKIKQRITPFVAKLFRIRRFISEEAALKLYYAHVYSHLIFMNAIWSVAPSYLIESLGVIQRRALRTVFKKDRLCHNHELFNENLLPLSLINIMHENIVLFKMNHNLMKNNVYLPTVNMIHGHDTRSKSNFACHSAVSSTAQKNFYARATKSYNDLPHYVKKFHSIGLFKTRLKEYLVTTIANDEI